MRGDGGPVRRRAVTLHDVAREAGVAVSTVSRALSDPGRVNVRTREHVQAVARGLGYRPNRLAQALPTGPHADAGGAGARHHQPAQLRTGAGRGGAGARRGFHAGDRRHAGGPGAGGRPTWTGWPPRSTASCSPRAGCPTPSCRPSPTASRSCCSTAGSTGWPAWSPTPPTAAARSSSTWSPSATGPWPTSPGRAAPGPTPNAGAPCPSTPRRPALAIVRCGPFAPDARGRAGRRRRRPGHGRDRTGRVQRPAGHRRAPPAGGAGRRRARRGSAWSGTTTSSAPTSAPRR